MDPFVLRVIASFVTGGLYVAGLIWVSERFSARVGGIIAGVPSTILISLIFIALTSGTEAARNAVVIIPAMIATALIFVYVFTKLAHKGHETALVSSCMVWALIATLFVNLNLHNIFINLIIGLAGMAAIYYGVRNYPSQMKGLAAVLKRTHLIRMIAAGTVIATAVVVARVSGPVWGGVFAAFPATTASTLYMLNKSQGCEFTKAVTKQFPLSYGASLLFVILFYLSAKPLSFTGGLIIGMIGAIMYAYCLQKFGEHSEGI